MPRPNQQGLLLHTEYPRLQMRNSSSLKLGESPPSSKSLVSDPVGIHGLGRACPDAELKEVPVPPASSLLSTHSYDIAVLRLAQSATLNSYVQLGVLPQSGTILANNTPCYITGWGRTKSKLPALAPSIPHMDTD